MEQNIEKLLTQLAFNMAEAIITKNIIRNKGHVHKNTPYVQNINEETLYGVPKQWGRTEQAIKNLELFNDILCNVIEKRLYWYYAEGFTEEHEDSFRFFSNEEIQEKNDEVYGQD